MVAVPAAGGCLPPPGRARGRWPSRQGMGKEEETAEVVVAAAGDPALTVVAAGSPTGTVPWREPVTSQDRLLLQARSAAAAAAKRKDLPPVNNEKANPASPGGAA